MTPSFPAWLHLLSVASLAVAAACAAVIAVDEVRRPQGMWIMNLVWPLTALFGGLLWLALYLTGGRAPARGAGEGKAEDGGSGDGRSMALAVAKGASHCGAGCTLGDIVGESLALAIPGIAVAFGWKTLFTDRMFAVWALDFALAFVFGVGFQFFTIAPMRHLSIRDGVWQALKADTASITAWQIGMFGFMAVAQFAWFQPAYGARAPSSTPEFWFAMQLAMLCGFATAYPVNWLLVMLGVKEKM